MFPIYERDPQWEWHYCVEDWHQRQPIIDVDNIGYGAMFHHCMALIHILDVWFPPKAYSKLQVYRCVGSYNGDRVSLWKIEIILYLVISYLKITF